MRPDVARPQSIRTSQDARTRFSTAACRRRGVRLPLLCAALALLVPATATLAALDAPVVYRWVDDQGVAHYTADLDRVPSSVRGRVNEVRSPSADAPDTRSERFAVENAAPASAPGAPGTVSAPVAASAAPLTPAPSVAPAAGAPPVSDATPVAPEDARAFEESTQPSTDTTLTALPPEAPSRALSAAPTTVASGDGANATSGDAATLDARIAAIEQEIARDEASLQTLLSEPTAEGVGPLADRPEFREIATRLPKLQADLRALQDQRPPTEP